MARQVVSYKAPHLGNCVLTQVAVAEAAGASEEEVTRALRDPASDIYRLGLMIQAVLTKLIGRGRVGADRRGKGRGSAG